MLRHLRFDGMGFRPALVCILFLIASVVHLARPSFQQPASANPTAPLTSQAAETQTSGETAVSASGETAAPETQVPETTVPGTGAETTVPGTGAVVDAVPGAGDSSAGDSSPDAEEPVDLGIGYALDNAVLFLCAVLVLLMQAGFALVEVGMNSSRNTINILYKNLMDLCVGALLFYIVGFGIMYPQLYQPVLAEGETAIALNPYFSFGGFGIYAGKVDRSLAPQTDWFFQAVFAATAATIVSGAVAGRMKFGAYLIYSAVLTGLIYPISGYWKWGLGWLTQMGRVVSETGEVSYTMQFQDFAGSVVVHAVGGFAGLAGAIILGARTGRFVNGESRPMPGHNMVYAALGVFLLWVGWYGFNPGSQLGFQATASIDSAIAVAVNTTLAAAAGGVVATMVSWIFYGKPDLSLSLNGVLGGLVGITAGCDCFSPEFSILVGAVAGGLVIVGVVLLERAQIDDPVGAWPVHGLCGVWGCMAIGFIPNTHLAAGKTSFLVQLIGTISICAWAFFTMLILFLLLKGCGILRVSAKEEEIGLDVAEHGMHAYYDTDTRTGK